jgi:hypothetical protein
MERAKKCMLRYHIQLALIYALIIAFFLLLASGSIGIGGIFVLGLCAILGANAFRKMAFKKLVFSVVSEKLDPHTFLATVYLGKYDTPAALWQLSGEYYCGHYQNVVSICMQKLSDKNLPDRFRYFYLTYLANVYFDIGDEEKLQAIYNEYKSYLSKEKPRAQAKYRKQFPRMAIYGLYLQKDWDGCFTRLNIPTTAELMRYHRAFWTAKLCYMDGDTDTAREYLQYLADKSPQLNYGKLSAKVLERLDQQADAPFSHLIALSETPTEVTMCPIRERKKLRIVYVVVAVLCLLVAIASLLISQREQQQQEQQAQAYVESIRVMVEEDYDGVQILRVFNLKKGNQVIEKMFLCQTDTYLLLGYTDGSDYGTLEKISLTELKLDFSKELTFVTTQYPHNLVTCRFFTSESDMPEKYYYCTDMEINGAGTVFTVTDISPYS